VSDSSALPQHRIGQAWREVRDRFRAADLDTPELDARLLAEAAFKLDSLGLVQHERDPATPEKAATLDRLAARRLEGEPVARILGHQEFYGLDFVLNAATLVPRPETELLVECALAALKERNSPLLLDLGTGCGCVAIAVLKHAPTAQAVATDLSEAAIAAARENAARHGVLDRMTFRAGSWCGPLLPDERFDVVVSNPPYVESDIIAELQPEVAVYDPRLALDGGEDGLAAYRAIATGLVGRIKPGGTLAVEVGSEQGIRVGAILAGAGLTAIDIRKDLAGLDRVVLGHQI